ncbi:MAG: AAA family ATPase [Gammaproteobacteria bacterium]|nr:AAA family ATPase [Gammaproteobacteria bacterium]
MKRFLMQDLIAWKNNPKRKPLILQGVRQTGKTFLLTEFGRAHFRRMHLINFEKQNIFVKLFQADLEPKRILDDLSFQLQTRIDLSQDLLIFDEIQACPNAITSLKYFCEDIPELAVCSAGSLLGLHLNDSSFPVGKVDMMHLYPMTFTEFLAGIGDEEAFNFVCDYKNGDNISDIKHNYLWERLKHYFIAGGLPEVVDTFRNFSENLFEATQSVRSKQEELIVAYYADIAKHSGKINAMHIDRTWRAVPMQLASSHEDSSSRFKFKDIIPGLDRYSKLVGVIDWLEAAQLIFRLPLVSSFEQPIQAYTKENMFKMMLFDVGLLGAMIAMDPGIILKYDYGTYKGYFAENFVGQQFLARKMSPLFSWQEDRSEIEFLFSYREGVVPIEVKAGYIIRAKSLEKYRNKYHPKYSIILSAKLPYYNLSQGSIYLPLYLAERIPELLHQLPGML